MRPEITNKMKKTCIGEFHVSVMIPCAACEYSEDIEADCIHCNGDGECEMRVPIPWTTMKDIYEMMYNCSPQLARLKELERKIEEDWNDCEIDYEPNHG